MGKKYETITAWVKREIESGALTYGSKLPPESELMERFSVSRQTVRRALKELADDQTVESRRGSGTYIKTRRGGGQGRQPRIAVMLTYIDTYIFPYIVKEIETVLSAAGCALQLSVTDNAVEKERRLLKEFLRTQSIDGLIAETIKSGLPNPNLHLYEKMKEAGIPIVFLNSFYGELDIPHISMDDRAAGYLAAKHLTGCGHIRIGGIFKSDDGQGHLRYAGYTQALMEADICVRGSNIVWIDSEEQKELESSKDRILKRLEGCTGCVCYNDETACRLINIFREYDIRVPQDISVVGIDDSPLSAYCGVPLTSVKNPVRELGRAAREMILGRILRREEMAAKEFAPELVMRDSVKMIRDIL